MRDKIVRKISKEHICGVYLVTNKINGKIYIGQSVDIERRWNQHRYGKGNIILANAIKKYGIDNFSFEILEQIECINLTKEQITDRLTIIEQEWFDKTKPFLRDTGYNIQTTSKPNLTPSRDKYFGEKISRIKIDNNHCGKKVKQYDLKGQLIKEWKSAADVERSLGFNAENISSSCLRKSKTSNGFVWRFDNDFVTVNDLSNLNNRTKPIRRSIIQKDLLGNLIKVWPSFKQLVSQSDFDNRSVKACCEFKRQNYKNFIWEYL